MTKQERKDAITKNGNHDIMFLLKTHRPCFQPTWSRFLYYVTKNELRDRALSEHLEYEVSKTTHGNKIIILKP